MKTYLYPEIMRLGEPVSVFVVCEGDDYWLGVDHTPNTDRGSFRDDARGAAYRGVYRTRISKAFYTEFLKDSAAQHANVVKK